MTAILSRPINRARIITPTRRSKLSGALCGEIRPAADGSGTPVGKGGEFDWDIKPLHNGHRVVVPVVEGVQPVFGPSVRW